MAVASRGRRSDLHFPSLKWKDRDTSPDRTMVWTEPNKVKNHERKLVPVVYYLCRNGQLEHPHFMEVPLSSPDGLFLRDVINRLNFLRGNGMASRYSWSSKRSYKSGYVWHDLEENDLIHPVHGGEYVLKGSELLETVSISKSSETASSSASKPPPEVVTYSGGECYVPARNRRRNQSWSAIDLPDYEYKVYKAETAGDFVGKAAADAATQTDDKRRRARAEVKEEPEIKGKEQVQQSTELSRGEISPPPSDSSPETLETLMKSDGKLVISTVDQQDSNRTAGYCPSGRMKASAVLMSLISCGSMSFRDCGATAVKDHGLSLISQYKSRFPRGGNPTEEEGSSRRIEKMTVEEKEYFSGSIVETKKDEYCPAVLRRSSSHNADRSSQLKLAEEEIEGARAKCMPRKPKKKDAEAEVISVSINSTREGNK